jgi:hypothetical protein
MKIEFDTTNLKAYGQRVKEKFQENPQFTLVAVGAVLSGGAALMNANTKRVNAKTARKNSKTWEKEVDRRNRHLG